MRTYTINHLRDVQDLAPALGVETAQEVRFPQMDAENTGLIEYLAFGPRASWTDHSNDRAPAPFVDERVIRPVRGHTLATVLFVI